MVVTTWGTMTAAQQAAFIGWIIRTDDTMEPQQQYRTESDALGEMTLPAHGLFGIHTQRAVDNFPLSGKGVHPALIQAYGAVKLACARCNREIGAWVDPHIADALEQACGEMMSGRLSEHILVDSLQGGAGTSLNMNVNEVIANRALLLLGHPPGTYRLVSPLEDVNRHQSTNDTFPTALRIAAIGLLQDLEERLTALQEAFQDKEKEYAHIVKVGRTECQDAVLLTLGREMGAYAEAFARDRWRIYKCRERLRTVNLGGTAVGTGLGAPTRYIFRVVDTLREVTGLALARAENLIEATQNADVYVEVSGMLKACATSLFKVCNDLRLLSSGPEAGLAEIRLPRRQAGSSIMPGKVNPVIPEAVSQAALMVMGWDQIIGTAAASGCLELNAFLPLIADCLLNSISLLVRSCDILRRLCIEEMTADVERCAHFIHTASATATALVPALGYEAAGRLAELARQSGRSLRRTVVEEGVLTEAAFDELISPEAVCRLGQR